MHNGLATKRPARRNDPGRARGERTSNRGKESGAVMHGLGAIVGTISGFDADGSPLVEWPEKPQAEAVVARSTCAVPPSRLGAEVVLVFERGDVGRPIVIGVLNHQHLDAPENAAAHAPAPAEAVDVHRDGERMVISANREIVLKCGKASITLTRAGKVLIRGAYLLNRSSGVNRIKGGSVQIN